MIIAPLAWLGTVLLNNDKTRQTQSPQAYVLFSMMFGDQALEQGVAMNV